MRRACWYGDTRRMPAVTVVDVDLGWASDWTHVDANHQAQVGSDGVHGRLVVARRCDQTIQEDDRCWLLSHRCFHHVVRLRGVEHTDRICRAQHRAQQGKLLDQS